VKAMDVIAFDVMQCWCQGGVWDIELGAFMEKLSKHGHGGRQLHEYLQLMWPKAYASGRDICKGGVYERAVPKDVKPNVSASELMSAGHVVRKYVEDVVMPTGLHPAHVESILRCIDVLDLLSQVITGRVTPAMLADAMAIHYKAHVIAYGYTLFVPKHHYMLHIPAQRFKTLVLCYVHERLHKRVKRWAVPLCPKKDNNRSLLEECTLAHFNSLQDHLLKPCLLETVKASPEIVAALERHGFASAATALTGKTARVQSRSIHDGDVALYLDGDGNKLVGEVYWFASIGGEVLVGLSTWQLKKERGRYRKVLMEDNLSIVPLARLVQAMIFAATEMGKTATVIMPAL
jgi:hypothetical protein